MTQSRKYPLALTLLAALALSACQPEPTHINPNSTATFGIHAVLYNADGSAATELPERFVLGVDAAVHTDHRGQILFIRLPPLMDESCLDAIQATNTEYAGPALSVSLKTECAKKFGRLTARNVGKRMALTLNEELITAPFIRTAITGGGVMIESNFKTPVEAEAVAREFY